jgi:hypothetical protein
VLIANDSTPAFGTEENIQLNSLENLTDTCNLSLDLRILIPKFAAFLIESHDRHGVCPHPPQWEEGRPLPTLGPLHLPYIDTLRHRLSRFQRHESAWIIGDASAQLFSFLCPFLHFFFGRFCLSFLSFGSLAVCSFLCLLWAAICMFLACLTDISFKSTGVWRTSRFINLTFRHGRKFCVTPPKFRHFSLKISLFCIFQTILGAPWPTSGSTKASVTRDRDQISTSTEGAVTRDCRFKTPVSLTFFLAALEPPWSWLSELIVN